MDLSLREKKCVPCEGGIPPMPLAEAQKYLRQLKEKWELVTDEDPVRKDVPAKKIRHEFKFKYFKEAMAFVNRVAELAEREGHHPDIHIFYNKVMIELWTHAIMGLSENDFIMAAKIENL